MEQLGENHQFTLTLGGNIQQNPCFGLFRLHIFLSSFAVLLSHGEARGHCCDSIPPSYGKSLGLVYDIGSATIFCSSPPPGPPGPILDPCLCRLRPTKAQVCTSRQNARNFLENYDPIKSVMSSKYFGVEADVTCQIKMAGSQADLTIYPYLSRWFCNQASNPLGNSFSSEAIHIYPYLSYLSYLSYLCPHTSPLSGHS